MEIDVFSTFWKTSISKILKINKIIKMIRCDLCHSSVWPQWPKSSIFVIHVTIFDGAVYSRRPPATPRESSVANFLINAQLAQRSLTWPQRGNQWFSGGDGGRTPNPMKINLTRDWLSEPGWVVIVLPTWAARKVTKSYKKQLNQAG